MKTDKLFIDNKDWKDLALNDEIGNSLVHDTNPGYQKMKSRFKYFLLFFVAIFVYFAINVFQHYKEVNDMVVPGNVYQRLVLQGSSLVVNEKETKLVTNNHVYSESDKIIINIIWYCLGLIPALFLATKNGIWSKEREGMLFNFIVLCIHIIASVTGPIWWLYCLYRYETNRLTRHSYGKDTDPLEI